MGTLDNADHQSAQQDLSRPYVLNEWLGDGNQGDLLVLVGTPDRRSLRRMGKEVFSAHHSILHMCTNTTHVD